MESEEPLLASVHRQAIDGRGAEDRASPRPRLYRKELVARARSFASVTRLDEGSRGERLAVDPRLDRPDLDGEPHRWERFELVEGPEHVLASDDAALPGYYRAVFVSDAGDRLERFLTDSGYGAVLRRREDPDPMMSLEEFRDWTVSPNLVALEARYHAEAGQGA